MGLIHQAWRMHKFVLFYIKVYAAMPPNFLICLLMFGFIIVPHYLHIFCVQTIILYWEYSMVYFLFI